MEEQGFRDKRRRGDEEDEEQGPSKKRSRNDEDNTNEQGKSGEVDTKDDPEQYTIGWVCALPKEQTAARAMLDEEFRDVAIRRAAGDNNAYTLGSMGRHNVVIACLPKGQLGVVRASRVATTMTLTFRNIKFVLMVGIGGGVPSGPNDVRLGDVVVSTPSGQYPGVAQWDFGKTKDGKFERTGSLNNPPTFLLSALSKMESDHELEGSKIQENLDAMFRKHPKLKAKYGRSDDLEDVLFPANYIHYDPPHDLNLPPEFGKIHDYQQMGTECLYCDRSSAEKRAFREPVIHYGLIASGNQVIKDAIYRDQINSFLDGNALCIEMEAAGLMNDFPCLVIRGICDYADSHKNKAWQEHAAAVAAALTKELLAYVPPVEVNSERTVVEKLARELQENFATVHSAALATKSKLAKLGVHSERNENERILQWLNPIEYGLQQSDLINRRQPGTVEWFLASEKYLAWLTSKPKSNHRTLLCLGIPGAGKTILMSAIIDDITRRFAHDENVGIAYIYCNFHRKHEQTLQSFLSSLVKQIARGLAKFPSIVTTLYDKNKRKGVLPTSVELLNILRSILGTFSTVFILIDALDECAVDVSSAFLSSLFDLQKYALTTIKLFVTSRFVPVGEKGFETAPKCEIRATNEDIQRYIRHRLRQMTMNITHLKEKIVDELPALVDGMFLLAQLYLDVLEDATSVREVLSALAGFKQKSSHLVGDKYDVFHVYDQVYEEAMERIRSQSANRRDLGTRVISWITHAARPLTTVELQHALTVDVENEMVDEECIRTVDVLVSTCAGIVTVDEKTDIIRLVHITAHEHFKKTQTKTFPGTQASIAAICAVYLSAAASIRPSLAVSSASQTRQIRQIRQTRQTRQTRKELKKQHPFSDYAANFWGIHTAKSSMVHQAVLSLLFNQDSLNLLDDCTFHRGLQCPKSGTALHWAAFYGAISLVDSVLDSGTEMSLDHSRQTPLFYAVQSGHVEVVRKLLARETVQMDWISTALHPAARRGDINILSMLLEKGAQVDFVDRIRGTALNVAVSESQTATVEYLLEQDADINSTGAYGRSALANATMAEDIPVEIVELLLRRGANIEVRDPLGRTPLALAVFHRRGDLAGILIDNGAAIDTADEFGSTPLALAILKHETAMVELLLERHAAVDSKDHRGFTPLSLAAAEGHCNLARMLLDRGADIDAILEDGRTPLFLASQKGHESMVRLLIEKGADIQAENHQSLTALSFASGFEQERVVHLLLQEGADPLSHIDELEEIEGPAVNVDDWLNDLRGLRRANRLLAPTQSISRALAPGENNHPAIGSYHLIEEV